MNGLITKATGSWYQVLLDNGSTVPCRLPGRFRLDREKVLHPVAVGDLVTITRQKDGTGVIEHIGERKNRLVRKATHGRRGVQLIATNVDQVLIVQSLRNPVVKAGFVDRVLVTCEAYQIPAVVIINKTDLSKKNKDAEILDQLEKLYTGLGYGFLRTSIHEQESIARLKVQTAGKISVLTGHSGTGKSSLLNTLSPGLNLKTGEISRSSNKGRHTTTYAQILPLGEQTFIVDTPGVREFGLVDVEPFEVSLYFPEMVDHRERCRFHNCTHRHEPSCAVRQALETGSISESRYRSFVNILESIESGLDKAL